MASPLHQPAAPTAGPLRQAASDLSRALGRLDRLLAAAVEIASETYGSHAAGERYRGLYVSHQDALDLLARAPGSPVLAAGDPDHADSVADPGAGPAGAAERPWAWLARTFALSPFDLDVVLLALAPHVDLKYERLYGYLHDDVTRRQLSVDLALNLLCRSAEDRLTRRGRFGPSAPLVRHRLVHLLAEPHQLQPPLLAHAVRLDEQIVNLLLGTDPLDARLAPLVDVQTSCPTLGDLAIGKELRRTLESLVGAQTRTGRPLRVYLRVDPGVDPRPFAAALANACGMPLIAGDIARIMAADIDVPLAATLLVRQAWLRSGLLALAGVDALRGDEGLLPQRQFAEALDGCGIPAVLSGVRRWCSLEHRPSGFVELVVSLPAFEQRRICWAAALTAAAIELRDEEVSALADRFQLSSQQIADAVATTRARLDPANGAHDLEGGTPLEALFAAARRQTGSALDTLARRIVPRHHWRDIVLPADPSEQLRQIGARVGSRQRVLGEWGFARRLGPNAGVNALFSGPPGTGKTMAAEVLANDLGLDLYKIDLSSVISKYIGETEKNLERIFVAAEQANVILFFDEADALFGKRSEVRDSHDRYANVEISYLLQRMEEYAGLAILATNLRQNMDDAFVRRLHFIVEFPFPSAADRERLWEAHFPPELPRAADVDAAALARSFKLAGGSIRSIVVDAAYLAAMDGGQVSARHLVQAARREYQKMGKVVPELTNGGAPLAVQMRRGA